MTRLRFAFVLSLATLAAASGVLPARAATDSDSAAQTYSDYCSVCHGERGDGRSHASRGLQPPPSDFTAPALRELLTRDYLRATIADGKPGTAMMAWKSRLGEQEIAALADYVRDTFVAPAARGGASAAETGGAAIYSRTCSVCHGEDGSGARWGRTSLDPPPVDFTRPGLGAHLARERMIRSVTNGRPGTAMTAFASQLNAAQIAEVVDFIRGRFMQAASHGSEPAAATGVGMAVVHGRAPDARHADAHAHAHGSQHAGSPSGEAARGRELYRRNCVDCHGERGDGQGPRAYFIFPRPRNLRAPAMRDGFDREHLVAAIGNGVVGREMPAWRTVLSDQQIADIVEYVYVELIGGEEDAR